MIYELPKDADIEDERNWELANPNLDVSVSREYIEDAVKKARHDQTYCDLIKRLHFNIKTDQSDSWLSLTVWDENNGAVDPVALEGRECYAGLDLSTVNDITALVLAFPSDEGLYDLLCYFWVPVEFAHVRERRDRVPYVAWSKEGLLELTQKKSVDYDVIHDKVVELSKIYDLREIGYDPYNAAHLVSQLEAEDFNMTKFNQGWRQMSPAAKYFSQLLLDGKIHHGGNKVLRWMASNVAVEKSKEENIKMDKNKSTEKIDGIVAAIMAIGMASTRDTDQMSVYETQEICVVG
jgi:phage terminase large subunit-like protein